MYGAQVSKRVGSGMVPQLLYSLPPLGLGTGGRDPGRRHRHDGRVGTAPDTPPQRGEVLGGARKPLYVVGVPIDGRGRLTLVGPIWHIYEYVWWESLSMVVV